jgi:hypothetical protein
MMTFDEFLSLKMPAPAKLIALFLASRPQRRFTHKEVGDACSIHQSDVEQAALYLLRHDETSMHPVISGIPSDFELLEDHPLRAAIEDMEIVAAGDGDDEADDDKTEEPPTSSPRMTKAQKKAKRKEAKAKEKEAAHG